MSTRVSIIVPCFNRAALIPDTIESVRRQSCSLWELIIVDDGSDDGSHEVVAAYCRLDSRIKLLTRNTPLRGASVCRNLGLRASRGEYVIFLDSDDVLAPWCLETRVRSLDASPESDFLVFPGLLFKQTPGDLSTLFNTLDIGDDLAALLRYDYPFQTASAIHRRTSLAETGPWDETLPNKQDWELFERLIVAGSRYRKLDGLPDFFFRVGAGGSLGAARSRPVLRSQAALHLRVARELQLGARLDSYAAEYLPVLLNLAEGLVAAGMRARAMAFWMSLPAALTLRSHDARAASALLIAYCFFGRWIYERLCWRSHRVSSLRNWQDRLSFMRVDAGHETMDRVRQRLIESGAIGAEPECGATPGQRGPC